MAVFGDPDYCVQRVQALRREYEMDEFICYFNQGGLMEHAMVRRVHDAVRQRGAAALPVGNDHVTCHQGGQP